jgi:hypothetical protein
MVINKVPIPILETSNCVSSVGNCGHRMEKLCTFISQLYSVNSIPLLPIDVFVSQQDLQLVFDDIPQIPFREIELPALF